MSLHKTKSLLVAFACALALCVVALTACGSKAGEGKLGSEFISETGAFKVTADDAALDAGITSGGAVTIKEGDVLLVSPDLTKGKLQLTLKDTSGKEVLNEEVSGRVLHTTEVAPGTYDVTVTCKEAGTTGSLLVHATSAQEFEAQDKALNETLEGMGVEL